MRPVSPVLTALRQEVALPSKLVGPVLSWALARLACSWAGETEAGETESVADASGSESSWTPTE